MGNAGSKIFRAVLLGLDAAGKTTVLRAISGKDLPTGPTIEHNFAKVKCMKGTITVWDVGGQQRLRALWRSVYYGTGAIIFVVDSTDETRIEIAHDELHSLLREQELAGVPLLVLANKQDANLALSPEVIRERLEVHLLHPRKVAVIGVSATTKQGIQQAIDWLESNILAPGDIPLEAATYRTALAQLEEAERSNMSSTDTD